MKLEEMKCGLCFWWDKETHRWPDPDQGECRGNPAQMVEDVDHPGFYYYVWPHTTEVDGCCNFKPKQGWEPSL